MYDKTVVALLDRPSPESFGMVGILIKYEDKYETLGLTENKFITQREFERLGGHILEVYSTLDNNLINPAALWIGNEFYSKATNLKAPQLPDTKDWNTPLHPHTSTGKYSFLETKQAYKTLDEWTTEAAREALLRNNYDLAKLTAWALPFSSASKAAIYFTTPTPEKQKQELKLYMRIDQKTEKELKEELEKTKEVLLR